MNDVKIIADLQDSEQVRIALLEDDRLAEIFIEYDPEGENRLSRQGDIFKARADTIIPAISAAFVTLTSKHSHANSPRNAFLYIEEGQDIKQGREVLVQVIKTARKNKAPRVSLRLAIPGRWLVLIPDSPESGVSRRITDSSERRRLKIIAESLKAEIPGMGLIVRTAAEGISEELLRSDMHSLLSLWNDIRNKAKHSPAPCLIYRDTGTLGRVLRDDISGRIDQIIINNPDEYEQAKSFVERFYPDKPDVQLYTGNTPIFEYFGIEQEIHKALDRKVWLRSGAYLVIDQTEALTVIDVNTGKFTSAPDMRHTTLATNLEAAEEIARQLRLRSIGGIVIVDFIDMDNSQDRHELISHMNKLFEHDRQKARVYGITQLGLVEITRKRDRPDLKSILTRNCPLCIDNGFVEREENIAMSIKRFIRKITLNNNAQAFIIQADIFIAGYIYQYLDSWEQEFGRKIFIAGMNDFERGKYKLDFQGNISEAENQAKLLRQKKAIVYRI